MRFKNHLQLLKQAFIPNKYFDIVHHSLKKIIFFQFTNVLLFLAVMLVLAIPAFILLPSSLQKDFQAFEQFDIIFEIQMNQPITLSEHPLVAVDLSKNNITDEELLLNNNGIHYKPFFKERYITWESLKSVPQNLQRYSVSLSILAILLIPSALLALILFFVIESIILFGITWILVYLITRLKSFSITSKNISKIIVFGLTPFLFVQILPFVYFKSILVPLVFFFIYVFFGVWIAGKTKYEASLRK